MILKVILGTHDIQRLIGDELRARFKDLAGKGEYVAVTFPTLPAPLEAAVEARREPQDARD